MSSVFDNLIGKRINAAFIGNDSWTLVFRTVEGHFYRYDTRNDCCNSVWVNHIAGLDAIGEGEDNSFDLLRGALVLSAEDKGWTDNRYDESGCEAVQDGFYTIKTDRGYIDIEVRNSHNGYYGGSFDAADYPKLSEISDLREVREDF
ncbi:MAG TPA: hypothetical protein VFM18_16850 [Methanosarcina sp.]|nr:hypothetical protein [Methanosarcina sp.]